MKKIQIHISEEPHCKDLESLGSIFMPLVRDIMSAEDFVEADILLNWREIVGEDIAAYAYPIKVKYNHKENIRTLYMEVPVGGFALEIQHKEDYLLEKLNAYFGYKAVHKINISQNIRIRPQIKSTKGTKERVKLSDTEKKYIESVADGIKDDKLKEILTKLGESVVLSNRERTKC